MRRTLRWLRNIAVLLVFFVGGLWAFGPREPIDATVTFDPEQVGDDVESYLSAQEARFAGITPGTEKRVLWSGTPGDRTDLALIYVHGYSATSEEIRPVPDRVAENLNANLFFTRLSGHGRDGEALAAVTMNAWVQDIAEAMEIGRQIGERVVLITTSTGGTLALAGAADAQVARGLAGIVLISPNFGPANRAAVIGNWPLARTWVPWLLGEIREWEPRNAQQARFWTTRAPTVALLPMMALVKYVDGLDLSAASTPALFVYAQADQVVSATRIDAAYDRYGGPKTRILRSVGPGDDANSHVIAGDIMSPGQTEETVAILTDWIAGLAP